MIATGAVRVTMIGGYPHFSEQDLFSLMGIARDPAGFLTVYGVLALIEELEKSRRLAIAEAARLRRLRDNPKLLQLLQTPLLAEEFAVNWPAGFPWPADIPHPGHPQMKGGAA